MLVISTATKKAYIGIEYKGKKFFSNIDADCKQSENILKEIDFLLEKNGLNFKDIGNISVVIGPGSFTGLRIGVALIKGLCAGSRNHKIYPISTLDLMSKINQERRPNKEYFCVMNALSNRLFCAKYSIDGKRLTADEMISADEINFKENIVFLSEEFKEKTGGIELSSEILLEYALELEKDNDGVEADRLQPVYIRKSQAEENIN